MFASSRLLTLPAKYVDLKIRKQTGVETRCVKRSIISYVPPVAEPEIIFLAASFSSFKMTFDRATR